MKFKSKNDKKKQNTIKVYTVKLLLLRQTKEFKNGKVKNIKQVS